MDATNTNTALSSVFVEELARCGLRMAVISPGSRSTPLAIALSRQPGIELKVAVDERSGSFFALGAAASGGLPVALLCTSGTAAANFHPAVAEADLSALPLIVLTADRPPELRDIGAGQTIDQIKLYGDAVRWFEEVGTHDADDDGLLHMRATACRAFAASRGEPRPGPVHLNLPLRDPLAPVPQPGSVTATDPLAIEGRDGSALTSVTKPSLTPDTGDIERVAGLVESAAKVMILAGRRTDPDLRDPAAKLAARLGAPLLAEPTSQLRLGPHDRSAVVSGYDRVLGSPEGPPRDLEPDLVIRLGETPTSKALRIWIAGLRRSTQVVIDPSCGWYEPSRIADLIVRAEPRPLLEALTGSTSAAHDDRYREAWLEAERRAAPEPETDSTSLSPATIHTTLGESYGDGDLVYTASSLAIREQESFLPTSAQDVLFLANRGANGIDGLIASAIGAATAAGRPVTVVTGELGFQHDLGSLALVSETNQPVKIVVINNGGGMIFSRLPQKQSMPPDEFDRLMSTPSRLSIEAAAGLFSLPFRVAHDRQELAACLSDRTTMVIEVAALP